MLKIKNLKQKIFLLAVLALAIAVGWFFKIPCVWKSLMGFPCPGCGMTRACVSALRFDFSSAFSYHIMFWSAPVLFLYFMADGRVFKSVFVDRAILIVIGVGFIINWILNILKFLH